MSTASLPEQCQEEMVEKVLKRAEISRITRNLKNRLALATFKAKHGLENLNLETLEPKFGREIKLPIWKKISNNITFSVPKKRDFVKNRKYPYKRKLNLDKNIHTIIEENEPEIQPTKKVKLQTENLPTFKKLPLQSHNPSPIKKPNTNTSIYTNSNLIPNKNLNGNVNLNLNSNLKTNTFSNSYQNTSPNINLNIENNLTFSNPSLTPFLQKDSIYSRFVSKNDHEKDNKLHNNSTSAPIQSSFDRPNLNTQSNNFDSQPTFPLHNSPIQIPGISIHPPENVQPMRVKTPPPRQYSTNNYNHNHQSHPQLCTPPTIYKTYNGKDAQNPNDIKEEEGADLLLYLATSPSPAQPSRFKPRSPELPLSNDSLSIKSSPLFQNGNFSSPSLPSSSSPALFNNPRVSLMSPPKQFGKFTSPIMQQSLDSFNPIKFNPNNIKLLHKNSNIKFGENMRYASHNLPSKDYVHTLPKSAEGTHSISYNMPPPPGTPGQPGFNFSEYINVFTPSPSQQQTTWSRTPISGVGRRKLIFD